MSKRELPPAKRAMRELFDHAVELLEAKTMARERLPLLRTAAIDAGLSIRDPELYALVAAGVGLVSLLLKLVVEQLLGGAKESRPIN